jgi:hypothetical protein
MYTVLVALLAALAWSGGKMGEPDEGAMRRAFASDLADGVRSALAFVARTSGEAALARIREVRNDAFEIRTFRKVACRAADDDTTSHHCEFVVEIATVAGPIECALSGRFFRAPSGLAFAYEG